MVSVFEIILVYTHVDVKQKLNVTNLLSSIVISTIYMYTLCFIYMIFNYSHHHYASGG